MKKKTPDYYALLTLPEFPQRLHTKQAIGEWLRMVALDIENSDSADYSKTMRYRMMKPVARVPRKKK